MYTQRNFNDDLYQICQSHYVKLKLLQDFASNRISKQYFVEQISARKDRDQINEVLNEVYRIQQKLLQNAGRFDEDLVETANRLRKSGKLQEAYSKIVPYLQQNKNDEKANLIFAWVMYDCLKASEHDPAAYSDNLKAMNDHVQFNFSENNNEYIVTLLERVLWSIRRVVIQGELPANKVFEQFRRFVGNSPAFIEQRHYHFSNDDEGCSPSRLLIKELCSKLNDVNYFSLLDMIGFDWFDNLDYVSSSFKGKSGETVEVRPFAEKMLNYYAKKLIQADGDFATRDRISIFIPKLTSTIKSHAEYEWLPYYRIKLWIKLGDKELAFSEITEFARNRSRDFWVWELISELVDGDDQFNCLCAALLCKTKPEMIVGLQERSIPYLIDRGFLSEAKHVLDSLIITRTNNGWKFSFKLQEMKGSNWYSSIEAVSGLESLEPFANEAKKILYCSLPFTDAFVSYINEEKGVINFLYIVGGETREGYFYKDSLVTNFEWKVHIPIRIKMFADTKRDNLYSIFEVEPGDEVFVNNFIKDFSGIFEKVNDFGFLRDSIAEIFVTPALVKENNLQPFSRVSGTILKKRDKKKNCWGWQITSITKVEEPNLLDFEKEVSGEIDIAMRGFGFIEECYVPAEIINSNNIDNLSYVKAKAQKSWDKSKGHWAWKVVEIIGVDKYASEAEYYQASDKAQEEYDAEFQKWTEEVDQKIKLQEEKRAAEYLKWVEDGFAAPRKIDL